MIVWVVKVEKCKCLFEHLGDAWADFKSHDNAMIYPKWISKHKFKNLKEFTGW